MSDSIFVKGLAVHAYHGVMQHEAKVGQTFTLDLKLTIDLSDASRSDKIAQCFRSFIRYPHRGQVIGAVTTCQLQCIQPIGLDPVPGLRRHQRRRYHITLDSQLRQLPVKYEAGWAGFVAGSQMLR